MKAVSRSQTGRSAEKAWFARIRSRTAVSVAAALVAGAVLRFWMAAKFFEVRDDSHLYGGLAKNLLLHGQYAISDGSGVLHTTLIRLPGYPLFLAASFQLFGMDKFFPAVVVQILCELAGCVMLALTARRICPAGWSGTARNRAAHATLWLAALCPFTAIYAASPLTESLTLFSITVALWLLARFQDRQTWTAALGFTLAVTYAALLRPDGALVGIALVGGMVGPLRAIAWKKRAAMVLVCFLVAAAPFGIWAARNWAQFHVFQPLAPRYATDPGEPTWPGFQRWVKTWSLDFKSTYEIYWNVPDGFFDLTKLPARAFDSPAQYQETAAIARAYEDNGEEIPADLDARFAKLAQERITAHPLRYYVLLPVGRVMDMLLRPRVENLPIDQDWWVYGHHRVETRFSWFYVILNLMFLALGAVGLWLRPRLWIWMAAYFVLRSALLATIEAPEARYTIEFFPMLFVLGGVAIGRFTSVRKPSPAAAH
jgi:hypothetical protein